MEPNTVHIEREGDAPVFTFADSFNVSVHMIDRHLNEGRADRLAYITDHEKVTYGQLAERVNRCGNALLSAGISPRTHANDCERLPRICVSLLRCH